MFRGAFSSNEMLKGYMDRESLGTSVVTDRQLLNNKLLLIDHPRLGRVMNRKGNMAKMNNRNDLLYLISSTSRLSESFMLTFLNARDIY